MAQGRFCRRSERRCRLVSRAINCYDCFMIDLVVVFDFYRVIEGPAVIGVRRVRKGIAHRFHGKDLAGRKEIARTEHMVYSPVRRGADAILAASVIRYEIQQMIPPLSSFDLLLHSHIFCERSYIIPYVVEIRYSSYLNKLSHRSLR